MGIFWSRWIYNRRNRKRKIWNKIILTLKEDTDDEKYSDYLAEYKLEELVRKYSDYIRYPIKMEVEHEKPVKSEDGKEENTKK